MNFVQKHVQEFWGFTALLISSPANDDWSAVERAEKAWEQAVLEAFWKRKAEGGNPLSSG